jgi:hypothetical protein
LRKLPDVKVDRADGITLITFTTMDGPAFQKWENWIRTLDDNVDDPDVSVLNLGPGPLLDEVMSILDHYRTLRAADFQHGAVPVLPVPVAHPPAVPAAVRYARGTMAFSMAPHRVATPQSPLTHPAITALPVGGLICVLSQNWARGAVVRFPVFRI